MKIYLMRHAHADFGSPDAERPLSAKGQRIAASMARFINGNKTFSIGEIWSSPYLRARQTAEPFQAIRGESAPLKLTSALLPEADPREILGEMRRVSCPTLLVGHNPHLSSLVQLILGMPEKGVPFSFKKAGLIILETNQASEGGFLLKAYLTPESLDLSS